MYYQDSPPLAYNQPVECPTALKGNAKILAGIVPAEIFRSVLNSSTFSGRQIPPGCDLSTESCSSKTSGDPTVAVGEATGAALLGAGVRPPEGAAGGLARSTFSGVISARGGAAEGRRSSARDRSRFRPAVHKGILQIN